MQIARVSQNRGSRDLELEVRGTSGPESSLPWFTISMLTDGTKGPLGVDAGSGLYLATQPMGIVEEDILS